MPTKYSVQPPDKHKNKGITTNFFIRIEEGPFKDVEYTYTKVQNNGVDDDDNFHLTFDYDVLYSPVPKVVREDFEGVLWDILKEILVQTAESIAEETEEEVFDELDTTVPDEFPLEEILPPKPES